MLKAAEQDITNFGGNVRWSSRLVRPATEAELLELLAASAGKTIRAIGSLHSWSAIAADAGITLDLAAFNTVELVRSNGRDLVRVGAGCPLHRLLDRLHAMSGLTLPTIGVIKKQTVAGAISTGTHGSGKQSLSHFVAAVRIAVFDAAGKPVVREFSDGPELLAVRCGLGCTGVLLSVDFETVPKYAVAETVRRYDDVEAIIAATAKHPLTAFAVWPHEGYLLVQERRALPQAPSGLIPWLKARFFRLFGLVAVDIAFALLVLASVKLGAHAVKAVQWFGPRALIKNRERIDDAEHVLTMRQDIFTHEEMELFVPQRDLAKALRFTQVSVRYFAGDGEFPDEFRDVVSDPGTAAMLAGKKGSYVLHYPIYCRRVLPEDTLMSMAASMDEPRFSISLFSYEAPDRREAYYALCLFVAQALRKLTDLRLHWGKHVPLRHPQTTESYPRFAEFRAICRAHDPNGVLRNAYTTQVLDLPPGPPHET